MGAGGKGLENELGANDTHTSPMEAIYLADRVMGAINWDPAGHPSNLFAERTSLLPIYRTPMPLPGVLTYEDSLELPEETWRIRGSIFLNPPWSKIDPWAAKLAACSLWAFLGPARANASWFHDIVRSADVLWFPHGRFTYGKAKTQPPFHSFMAFRGVSPEALLRVIPTFFPKSANPCVLPTKEYL